jgi:hypothetical protein
VRLANVVPWAALVLSGAAALAFDLTLQSRLPSDEDWADAAAALRVRTQPGDEVQLWPPWAERARLFVESMPIRTEEDLRAADYVGALRLWLLALPRVPNGDLRGARAALKSRGATEGESVRFGALTLTPWDLHAPPLLADFTGGSEEHEVDYVPRRCRETRIPSELAFRGPGGLLHVRAGVIGERAYQAFRDPVRVEVRVDGAPAATLTVPVTVPPESGWRRLEVRVAPGEHAYALLVSARDRDRPFCVAAWVTGA